MSQVSRVFVSTRVLGPVLLSTCYELYILTVSYRHRHCGWSAR